MTDKPTDEECEARIKVLDSLISNTPGMLYSGRPDWKTEIITRSEEISGYSVDEFNSGKINWMDIVPHEKKEVVKRQIFDKRRILLVEDETTIADVQYQILTSEPFGHIVSIAANGQMAIDIFGRNNFDLVSLDYMLPGKINGLDVYNHIRQKDKDVPVMFISGNIAFLESMAQLTENDPNLDHLSKPVDNLEYVNKINELIGKSTK